TGATSRALAAKYGFTLTNTGAGAATYNVPSADWAAFGLTSTTSTQSILQLLLLANKYAVAGKLNGGNQTLINETNDVFNAINNQGDIGTGMALVTSGTAAGSSAGLGQLYAGTYVVSIDGLAGSQADDEAARIQDAIDLLNSTLATFGVMLVEATDGVTATPDIQVHMAATSVIGGVAEGVLGVTSLGGQITLINGWNWYTGSDTGTVGAGQYDFQTVVTHELGQIGRAS